MVSFNCLFLLGFYGILFFFLKVFYFKLYLYEYTVAVFKHTGKEGIRSHYRWLWATMWLLGIELRTFERAASALNR